MNDRKTVHDHKIIDELIYDSISLAELRELTGELIIQYGIESTIERDYWGCGEYELAIHFTRPETDEEYAKRLQLEERVAKRKKSDKQIKEEKERKEYERLKKKFEKQG